MIRLIAEAAPWWKQYAEIVRSPAHYLGEFTIETVFALVGVHTIHKLLHGVLHTVTRRFAALARGVAEHAGRAR